MEFKAFIYLFVHSSSAILFKTYLVVKTVPTTQIAAKDAQQNIIIANISHGRLTILDRIIIATSLFEFCVWINWTRELI